MKKIFLIVIAVICSVNFCQSQEWFTSFDVAKRLAIVQNKMLFVLWEESLDYPYPLLIKNENGQTELIDLSKNEAIDSLIWEYFVPVLLPESEYDDLFEASKNYGSRYVVKLNDDSIKIMDVNKNILNVNLASGYDQDFVKIIKKYGFNTKFLNQDLRNYMRKADLTTSYNLGDKYIDFAIYVDKEARYEVIELANIYLNEAKNHLSKNNIENKEAYLQRLELLEVKKHLILDKPRKAQRLLKRIEKGSIADSNQPLYVFLNYTTFTLLKDEKASAWEKQISEKNRREAEFIIRNNNN